MGPRRRQAHTGDGRRAGGLTLELPDGPVTLRRGGDGVVTISRASGAPPPLVHLGQAVAADALRRDAITPEALAQAAGVAQASVPAELAAVLGDGRFRHLGEARWPAYSPDGKRLAVPTGEGTVPVHDVATGRRLPSCSTTRTGW